MTTWLGHKKNIDTHFLWPHDLDTQKEYLHTSYDHMTWTHKKNIDTHFLCIHDLDTQKEYRHTLLMYTWFGLNFPMATWLRNRNIINTNFIRWHDMNTEILSTFASYEDMSWTQNFYETKCLNKMRYPFDFFIQWHIILRRLFNVNAILCVKQ